MSEQEQVKKSFMQELDKWTEQVVIMPLVKPYGEGEVEDFDEVVAEVKKAIRDKVLQSYRNGQAAPKTAPKPVRKEFRR